MLKNDSGINDPCCDYDVCDGCESSKKYRTVILGDGDYTDAIFIREQKSELKKGDNAVFCKNCYNDFIEIFRREAEDIINAYSEVNFNMPTLDFIKSNDISFNMPTNELLEFADDFINEDVSIVLKPSEVINAKKDIYTASDFAVKIGNSYIWHLDNDSFYLES